MEKKFSFKKGYFFGKKRFYKDGAKKSILI